MANCEYPGCKRIAYGKFAWVAPVSEKVKDGSLQYEARLCSQHAIFNSNNPEFNKHFEKTAKKVR